MKKIQISVSLSLRHSRKHVYFLKCWFLVTAQTYSVHYHRRVKIDIKQAEIREFWLLLASKPYPAAGRCLRQKSPDEPRGCCLRCIKQQTKKVISPEELTAKQMLLLWKPTLSGPNRIESILFGPIRHSLGSIQYLQYVILIVTHHTY